MLYEILILTLIGFAAIVAVVLWFENDVGLLGRISGSVVLAALCGLLFTERFHTVERVQVVGVNRNRAEAEAFSVGSTVSVDRPLKEGLLDPFELAIRPPNGRLEVIRNDNSIVWWKFNKRAMQLEFAEGTTYDLQIAGWFGTRRMIDIIRTHAPPPPQAPNAPVDSPH